MTTLLRRLVTLAVLAVSLSGLSGHTLAQSPDDERAIRALIESHSVALNNGDISGASSVYSDDATIVTASGQMYVGRTGVERWHTEARSGPTPFVHTHPPESIRLYFLRPDSAVADVESHIPRPAAADGQPGPVVRAPLFIGLVKRDGQWRIAAQRQTLASPKQ